MNSVTLNRDELEELIGKSHQAVSAIASNSLADFKERLTQVNNRNEREHMQLMDFMNETKQSQIRIEDILSAHGETINKTWIQAKETNGKVREQEITITDAKGLAKGVGVCLSVMMVLIGLIFTLQVSNINLAIDNLEKLLDQHINVNAQTK